MIGERGGSTATFQDGADLIDLHKGNLKARVRADILDWLESHPTWHANDLRVAVPANSRNVMPAVLAGLTRSGLIEKTGERRKATAKASHGRDSNVFRLSADGSRSETEVHSAVSSESSLGVSTLPVDPRPGITGPGAVANTGRVGSRQESGTGEGERTSSPARLFPLPPVNGHCGNEAA